MTHFVCDPGNLRTLQDDFLSGKSDPVQVAESLLQRAAEIDGDIHAWISLDADDVLSQARQCREDIRAGRHRSALHGIPVAIKDVIDLAGLPTRANSPSRRDALAAPMDADIVGMLRSAGAIIMGKVHTTEYAYFDGPPPTRNPWRTTHTPGGSSAGSAAAVAAGMVPCSIGTQTAGSVVRPAAYCGIAAFKPTTQNLSTFGMVALAPSFDTIGWFGYRMSDVALAAHALQPARFGSCGAPRSAPLAIIEDDLLDQADDAVRENVGDIIAKLRSAGHDVVVERSPIAFQHLIDWHRTVLEFELSRIHHGLEVTHAHEIAPGWLGAIRRGLTIAPAAYLAARDCIRHAQDVCWQAWARYQAVLVPAAPGIAPEGMPTGDPRHIIPMTALGGPIATIPTGFGTHGMPLGLMIASRPDSDASLIATSLRLADAIETSRNPTCRETAPRTAG